MRWWRQALEAKASRTGPLIAFSHTGAPVWTPRHYAALARRGYMENAIVYRAVRLVSEAAASVPLLLYEGARELAEHPLLALLARPNPRQAGAELFEAAYGHLLTSGNAYLEAVTGSDGEIREIYALRPDRMKVIAGPDGWAQAYEYSVAGQSLRFQMPEEGLSPILHLTLFHPLNDYYGFAPLEAAQKALDLHNEASAWNKALLENAARPSGALVYQGPEGANLSEDQFARLKGELTENFEGAANAGRPLLLEGGLSWQAMSLSPKDMDFLEAKNAAAREIALAFGVPPMLLGIPGDNTYSNYQEANRALWRQTVLPLIGRMTGALSNWLAPSFGERLRLSYDADQIDALAADRAERWKRLSEASFLSDDEKREALGYGPLEA
ncbi:phage portal protein [Afifella marina]|uniref:Phage portal protein, HK97 family n=1 Tax=Afifella marina DSM 2698 TaxID=1120955 RepID=A0A1G5MIA1_AFIMA|nr:phage portal protein [Afifella marina]MBK1625360.1 phage portal protein [Afifella marina DSM 2698]MBK1629025.1 phage portal protein [Afifella marina]MBK5916903.1 phage portal protein [Afifella marina]RAI22798.1 phage portal protein [Afifella marina DSM 2698]SCZ24110.1 phage portal protein, HK97 family [Afifella marina DSM 2698]